LKAHFMDDASSSSEEGHLNMIKVLENVYSTLQPRFRATTTQDENMEAIPKNPLLVNRFQGLAVEDTPESEDSVTEQDNAVISEWKSKQVCIRLILRAMGTTS
jgi:ATP-dependent Clp protease ATP-binding subunit ClpA